jgi:osmotically-inducible protein OsmY
MHGRALALSIVLLGVSVFAVNQRSTSVPGRVDTFTEVTTASRQVSDDALRRAIARAIYGHPTFWREAALPQPPIRIDVVDGHVTLTGIVAGELERALACSLARGHGEASLTNRLRTRVATFN